MIFANEAFSQISILFMQGKLPRKSSLQSSGSVHGAISSPLLPTTRPASTPITRPYSVDHYSYTLNTSKSLAVSSYSHYQEYHDTTILSSPLGSPPIREVYNSDAEESLYPHEDESGMLGDDALSSFLETWTENPHLDPLPFLMHEKSYTDNILGCSVYQGLEDIITADGVYPQ